MQDRGKANHDLGKDAKINHVLDKGSMVANPFFWYLLVFEAMLSLPRSIFPHGPSLEPHSTFCTCERYIAGQNSVKLLAELKIYYSHSYCSQPRPS